MRKFYTTLLCFTAALLLSGCCISHKWMPANCEAPKTCEKCGETEGEPLGHSMAEAACEMPETCTLCGITQGEALGHDWQEAACEAAEICRVCNKQTGTAAGHKLHGGELTFRDDGSVVYIGNCVVCEKNVTENYVDVESFANRAILGKWYCVAMRAGNVTYGVPEDVTETVFVEFCEDGTGTSVLYGEEEKTTWRFESAESHRESAAEKIMHYFIYYVDVELNGESYTNLVQLQIQDTDRLFNKDYSAVLYYDSEDVLNQ